MDVLEYLNEDQLSRFLEEISGAASLIASFSPHPDIYAGYDLRMIQKPDDWWLKTLVRSFQNVQVINIPEEPDRKIFICE